VNRQWVRFLRNGRPRWGIKQGDRVDIISAAPWADQEPTGESVPFNSIELLAPAEPTKIVCVGLNYKDHAAEMNEALPEEPKIFMKPITALLDPGKPIRYPRQSQRVDFEAELAFVLGKTVGPGLDDQDAIFGYTCANDVTARDLQKRDGQWTRAKGFDSFCPLGPVLVSGLNVDNLKVECSLNGEPKQSGRTSNLIFNPMQILYFVAEVMTLSPGDVILTGTPAGIGPMKVGDEVEVSIEGIGRLNNLVIPS